MTIRELLEKTVLCDYMEITIRKDGCGEWVYRYKVGENANNCKYDEILVKDKWIQTDKCLKFQEPTEFRTNCGGGHYLCGRIIPKKPEKAPKEVLDLEICDFQAMTVFSERNHWGIFATAFPKGWTKPVPEVKQRDMEQMTLF